ncbi:hypothetical protein ASC95_07630 [Pelomonas sp. Root1217]|uniref:hypothetical protein n=1 Tax=Pelomonas sp. Root1217 TaxID=1736430 RepID=UPI00070A7C84|nr:hypothetical protein [Pelomonas sp. Root1217]KQV52684.1 hypothetical protein ASC95_07630 [Pelomonas sp. Root1217]
MDPNLTWLLLIAAVALIAIIAFGAVRLDLLAAQWREVFGQPPLPHDAPPAPRRTSAPGFTPHEAPLHKPAFHRSGRRH